MRKEPVWRELESSGRVLQARQQKVSVGWKPIHRRRSSLKADGQRILLLHLLSSCLCSFSLAAFLLELLVTVERTDLVGFIFTSGPTDQFICWFLSSPEAASPFLFPCFFSYLRPIFRSKVLQTSLIKHSLPSILL